MKMNRRTFVAGTAVGAMALGRRTAAASDKVTIAVMGVRGRGRSLCEDFADLPDVNIAYLCDVDSRVFERAVKIVEGKKGKKPQLISDIRRALDDPAVDAVVVATPDHWHAPATILACDAGKDVYVEKPASHNIREGQLMLEAARRNGRVVQVGMQSRSRPSTQRAIEAVHSGRIGKVLMAKAWDVQLRDDIGHQKDSAPPPEVDYDNWVGPAPMLPFNENRFHYKWHWNWNFGTGDIGNDGAHQIDQARWALGVDLPTEVSGMGRKLCFQDDQQTPDTMTISFNYPDKVLLWEMRIWCPYGMEGIQNAMAVFGSEGSVHVGRMGGGRWGYRILDPDGNLILLDTDNAPEQHHSNFIECVRSREAPAADIQIGHTSTVLCHLGNIVARTGRHLKINPETEEIVGDAEAQALAGRQYRDHWATPQVT